MNSFGSTSPAANHRITAHRVSRRDRAALATASRFGLRTLGTLERNARRVVITSVALLLTACSSVRLGYNNADTLLVYGLDSYLELNEGQTRLVQERVQALLAWHRQTQLPHYAQMLQHVQDTVSGEVTASDMLALRGEIEQQILALADRAAPDIAALALTLTPAQIDHGERHLAEQAAKTQRELAQLDAEKLQGQREERQIQRAQWWFGPLSKPQLAVIRSATGADAATAEGWHQERERRQAEFVAVLRQIQRDQPGLDAATQQMREYFAHLFAPADATRAQQVRAYRQSEAALQAGLIGAASIKQRAVLLRRLRDYTEDVAALSAPPREQDG